MAPRKHRKQRKHRTRRQRGGGFLDWIKEKLGMGQSAAAAPNPTGTGTGNLNPSASGQTAPVTAVQAPAGLNPVRSGAPNPNGQPPFTGGKRRSRTKRRHNRKTQRKH